MPWSWFGYQRSPFFGVDPRALVKLEMTARSFDRLAREAATKEAAMRKRASKCMQTRDREMARIYTLSSLENAASKERYTRMALRVAGIKRDVQYHALAGTMTEELTEIMRHVSDIVSPQAAGENLAEMERILLDVAVVTGETEDGLDSVASSGNANANAKTNADRVEDMLDEMEAETFYDSQPLDLPAIDKSGKIISN